MATYLIKKEQHLTRQEGDTADIVFTMPELFPMVNYNIKFKAFANSGALIISKDSSAGTIAVIDQTVSIPLLSDDTKGKSGKHRYEIEIYNDTPEVITIARGYFNILPERIK